MDIKILANSIRDLKIDKNMRKKNELRAKNVPNMYQICTFDDDKRWYLTFFFFLFCRGKMDLKI